MTGAEIAFCAGWLVGAVSIIVLHLLRAIPEEQEEE